MNGRRLAALGLAFTVVLGLGTIGFSRAQEAGGALEPLLSRIYMALQLFVLEGGTISGAVPLELEVARFAAPVVAGYALVLGLALLFREQLEWLRLRFVRGHFVVAGLGVKGMRLTRALLKRGEQVVVIEANGTSADLANARALGALVVVGDARNPDTLRRAGVHRAQQLVVLVGHDARTAEIVASARDSVLGRRRGHLRCVAIVENADLCQVLCIKELRQGGSERIRVEFVNPQLAAVQALVRSHPPVVPADGRTPSVLISGGGSTAAQLLLAIGRAVAADATRRRLAVTVVGPTAQAVAALTRRHPELDRVLDLRAGDDLLSAIEAQPPTTVYVCPDDDAVAATEAVDIRQLLAGRSARVVVAFDEQSGLVGVLGELPASVSEPTVVAHALLDEAWEPDVLLSGTVELLARQLHRVYLDAHGRPAAAPSDPALRPWSELPDDLRESNRSQAAHVGVKLAAIGYGVGPLVDWDAAQLTFSSEQVEVMSRLEHDRWVTERQGAGWRPGPRDARRRMTPDLVPWEVLSEDVRELDRMFVRSLPELLAGVGLQAVPVSGEPPAPQVQPEERRSAA
jgi:hypothetical protein